MKSKKAKSNSFFGKNSEAPKSSSDQKEDEVEVYISSDEFDRGSSQLKQDNVDNDSIEEEIYSDSGDQIEEEQKHLKYSPIFETHRNIQELVNQYFPDLEISFDAMIKIETKALPLSSIDRVLKEIKQQNASIKTNEVLSEKLIKIINENIIESEPSSPAKFKK
ncbi:MAG: hypothetical protein P4M12_11620 [Gammaproteobacteria bacterium]|nr:hypothetical protein [Gammaproteobacteria bacterium]